MRLTFALVLALAAGAAGAAGADEREAYNRRAAATDAARFQELDLNRDGRLSRDEARGDLHLAPRFDDMDINRDGIITPEELRRYLEQTYGFTAS